MATDSSIVTLAELKKRVLERADMVNSDFIDDTEGNSELVRYIQQSYRALYNIIINAFADFYVEDPVEFTLSPGESTYTLPSDFYRLVGVDFETNGNWQEIKVFNFNERNRTNNVWRRGFVRSIRYRLMGNKLRFTPTDQADGKYRYWYIKKPEVPVDDTDTIDGFNGWDEYVVVDAAMKCLDKEESDYQLLLIEREQLKNDIMSNAGTRDESGVQTVQDVNNSYDYEDEFF